MARRGAFGSTLALAFQSVHTTKYISCKQIIHTLPPIQVSLLPSNQPATAHSPFNQSHSYSTPFAQPYSTASSSPPPAAAIRETRLENLSFRNFSFILRILSSIIIGSTSRPFSGTRITLEYHQPLHIVDSPQKRVRPFYALFSYTIFEPYLSRQNLEAT